MPFIKCSKCKSVSHASPIHIEEFHKKYILGKDPYICGLCLKNSFTFWFRREFGEEWVEEDAMLHSYAIDMAGRYENWCKNNKIEPTWNG